MPGSWWCTSADPEAWPVRDIRNLLTILSAIRINLLMRQIVLGLVALGCAAAMTFTASAQSSSLTLSLQPSSAIVELGNQTAVDVILSGLVAPPGIAGYYIELSYDAALVSPVSVVHGTQLGTFISSDDLGANPLSVSEVSLEIAPFFDSQPGSFTLVTLFFQGLSYGLSPLTFGAGTSLTDENVNSLVFSTVNGQIQVVPETGSTAFALVGLATAIGFVQFRRRCQA